MSGIPYTTALAIASIERGHPAAADHRSESSSPAAPVIAYHYLTFMPELG
jgi:hypothetical protein